MPAVVLKGVRFAHPPIAPVRAALRAVLRWASRSLRDAVAGAALSRTQVLSSSLA